MIQTILSNLKTKALSLYNEYKRTGWAIGLLVLGAVFISRGGHDIFIQQLGVLAWKLVLIGTGTLVAHKLRTQLFPYLDLSKELSDDNSEGGLIFLGVCIFTAAIILALCSGL